MNRECSGGLAGCFFGHRMRPRYSTATTAPEWMDTLLRRAQGKLTFNAEYYQPNEVRTYEGDVCTRCGYTVKPGG